MNLGAFLLAAAATVASTGFVLMLVEFLFGPRDE